MCLLTLEMLAALLRLPPLELLVYLSVNNSFLRAAAVMRRELLLSSIALYPEGRFLRLKGLTAMELELLPIW